MLKLLGISTVCAGIWLASLGIGCSDTTLKVAKVPGAVHIKYKYERVNAEWPEEFVSHEKAAGESVPKRPARQIGTAEYWGTNTGALWTQSDPKMPKDAPALGFVFNGKYMVSGELSVIMHRKRSSSDEQKYTPCIRFVDDSDEIDF